MAAVKVQLTAAERAQIAAIRGGAARARQMVTTNIPAAHQTPCPKCGRPGHATIIASWGHCMTCQKEV